MSQPLPSVVAAPVRRTAPRRPRTLCRGRRAPSTLFAWQREARAAPAPPPARHGITLIVRSPAGREAEVTGLDAATVVTLLLGPPEQITHLGCWAHAQRYLAEAVRLGNPRAAPCLAQVGRLFRLDAGARRIVRATPAASRPAVAARVATWSARFGLTRCVTPPGAYRDNNAAENAIRQLKLGANNWLFVGHPDAGPRLANLFTLVENCRQAGIDPGVYLLDLLTRRPAHSMRRLGEWLPRAWQRARADGLTP